MIVLGLFHLAPGLIFDGHTPFQAIVTAAAETGEHFNAIQGGHQAALDATGMEGLGPLEAAIDLHQHGLQRLEIKATQAVAQGIVAEATWSTAPLWQIGVSQFAVQLLKAGEAKDESVEQSEKDALRRDFGLEAGIHHLRGVVAQPEALIGPGPEGRQCVVPIFQP